MNSMAVLLCVQNPYRHRPVLRENEWQNCGKKFDFKSLKWRIISLVQPFLSVFCYIVLSNTTKNYYQMILPLLPLIINLSTKKVWIITAKWVITMFKRQPVNHPKKFLKKFYMTVKMYNASQSVWKLWKMSHFTWSNWYRNVVLLYVHQKSIIREEKKDYKSPWHRITQPLSA